MTLPQLSFAILAICCYPLVSARSVQSETSICTAGPLEWCSDFTTAANCDVVQFCIITDWSELKVSSHENSCQACVDAINNIREGIGSNVTKEVIQEALDAVCELTIFTRILRKQCEKLINTYVDSHLNDLLDLLKSDIDPRIICKIVDLCATHPTEGKLAELEEFAVRSNDVLLHFPADDLEFFNGFEESTELPLVGSKRCTWGPSYWCGNLTTSKECSSTTQCIANYWSQIKYEEDNDSVCQVCKDMVKQARDQLLSNETQEELKEVLEGSCKLIPLKQVRDECIKLADEFVPELTEVLASQMDPTAVCTVAGLCNSARIDNLLANAKQTSAVMDLSAMSSCVNCTVGLTTFQRYVQSSAKSDVLSKLLAVCGEMSSFSDLCNSLIVSNFDDIYGVVNNPLPPFAFCHLSGMCSYQYHTHMVFDDDLFIRQVDTMLATKNDDLPCDLCKQLVHHLQEVLVANTTEDEFQQMLLGMCQQTGNFKDECTKLVNENFKLIYQFLTEELDPAKICAEIGICQRSKNYVSDAGLNLITGRGPVLPPADAEPASSQEVASASSSVDTHVDSIECKLCHSLMKIIQKELDDPKYDHDVEKVLEEVCTLVPKADREKCDEFVDEYAETLIKILADNTDPFEVCRMLKICPSTESVSNALCPLCQYLLHYIQEAMEDPHDEKQIEEAVKKVCSIVPSAERAKCDEFISQYSALIITILAQEIDPSLVCPAMKLCPTSSSPAERCGHCRMFMTDLIGQLDSNYEMDHVKDKVSSLIPRDELEQSATALQLKFAHREDLIDMMVTEFDADESCVFLKFCNAQDVSAAALPAPVVGDVETNEISDSVPSAPTKPSCEICELFVKMYEKELTSNKTEEEIEDMLEKFCNRFGNNEFKKNCTEMVKRAVPIFFDLLKKNVSPEELCKAAKFCSTYSLSGNIDSECRACEVAVGSLESVLSDPLIKENVFERVIKICDEMTGRSRMICTDVISQLLPEVQGVVFDIPPWFVCSKLRMCPYGQYLDTSVCSNPQLWCQDKETAFLCNRLNFCHVNARSSIP